MGRLKKELTKKEIKKLHDLFTQVAKGEIFFADLYQQAKGTSSPNKINELFKKWCYDNKKKTIK
jgi:hypothetical protein